RVPARADRHVAVRPAAAGHHGVGGRRAARIAALGPVPRPEHGRHAAVADPVPRAAAVPGQPASQFLNGPGGVTAVRDVSYAGADVRVDGRRVIPVTRPAAFGAETFDG